MGCQISSGLTSRFESNFKPGVLQIIPNSPDHDHGDGERGVY